MENKKNFISIKEAIEVVPITRITLMEWISQRKYPQIFLKLGGNIFIDKSELTRIYMKRSKLIEQVIDLHGWPIEESVIKISMLTTLSLEGVRYFKRKNNNTDRRLN